MPEVKIQVTTQAQTQGLKQAGDALKDVGKAADKLDVSKKTLIGTLNKLSHAIPGLSYAVNALKSPYFLLAAAIGTAIEAFRRFHTEVEERAARAQGFANLTEQFGGFRAEAMRAKVGAEEFAASLARLEAAAGGTQEKFKAYADALQQVQALEMQLIDAQTGLEVAQIRGNQRLTPEQRAVAIGQAQMRGETRREDNRGRREMDKQLAQEAEMWQAREDALNATDELAAAEKNLAEVTQRAATLRESARQTLETMPERRKRAGEAVRSAQDWAEWARNVKRGPDGRDLIGPAEANLAAAESAHRELSSQASGAEAGMIQADGMLVGAQGRVTRARGSLMTAETQRLGAIGAMDRDAFIRSGTEPVRSALQDTKLATIQQESGAAAAEARAQSEAQAASAVSKLAGEAARFVGAVQSLSAILETGSESVRRLKMREQTDPFQ